MRASFRLARRHSSGRSQARGGRKGGLPACEENGLATNDAVIFAKAEGNTITTDVAARLKHLSAQVAMAAQSSMAFSQGLALGGQQSGMSSVAEVPTASGDFHAHASTAGCRQHAYRQSDQKRYNGAADAHGWACVKIAGCSRPRSSDDFASGFQLP